MGSYKGSNGGFGGRDRFSSGNSRDSRDRRPRSGGFGGRDRGRSFGSGRDRGRSSGRREFHDVICDKCKKECKVPFKPSNDKPVLCSECFEKKGRSSRGSDASKEQLDKINTKLDKILKVLSELEMTPEEETEAVEEVKEDSE